MTSKPTRQAVEPLKTRHVFFDTEVYRRAGFNLKNSQFKTFGQYVEAGRLSLHTTDITFAEVNRQIGEAVADKDFPSEQNRQRLWPNVTNVR